MRTFEVPAVFVGMSENPVILLLALKSVPAAAVWGCGAEGKSFLLWPASTTSALLAAKKSVLTKSFFCRPAVSAGTFAGGGGGAIDGKSPPVAAILALAGSSRFICARASLAFRSRAFRSRSMRAVDDTGVLPDGAGAAGFDSGVAV